METQKLTARFGWIGLSFIAGMTIFGVLVGGAVIKAKSFDTYVSVKGLSEREVPADLAIWPISFSVSADDLSSLQEQNLKARTIIKEFLAAEGFNQTDISTPPPQIIDMESRNEDFEEKAGAKRRFRYVARATVLLRSTQVTLVKTALDRCDRLVQQGIALSGGDYMSRPQFLFTGLNAIKPDMIQEANKNARQAAARFSEDSGSGVGSIRRATQGPFEIYDVDASAPDRKVVRVVTTVDYYLN